MPPSMSLVSPWMRRGDASSNLPYAIRPGGAMLGRNAGEAMNARPKTILAQELAARAPAILEERKII